MMGGSGRRELNTPLCMYSLHPHIHRDTWIFLRVWTSPWPSTCSDIRRMICAGRATQCPKNREKRRTRALSWWSSGRPRCVGAICQNGRTKERERERKRGERRGYRRQWSQSASASRRDAGTERGAFFDLTSIRIAHYFIPTLMLHDPSSLSRKNVTSINWQHFYWSNYREFFNFEVSSPSFIGLFDFFSILSFWSKSFGVSLIRCYSSIDQSFLVSSRKLWSFRKTARCRFDRFSVLNLSVQLFFFFCCAILKFCIRCYKSSVKELCLILQIYDNSSPCIWWVIPIFSKLLVVFFSLSYILTLRLDDKILFVFGFAFGFLSNPAFWL